MTGARASGNAPVMFPACVFGAGAALLAWLLLCHTSALIQAKTHEARSLGGGFVPLAAAWRVLYAAQETHQLATTGPYAHLRHPQYVGFILIMLGFLFQWPTLLTLLMFPILVWMYVRLAGREEREVRAEFGGVCSLRGATPAFVPRPCRAASAAPEAV